MASYPTIGTLLAEAERRFYGSDTARLDAEVLLCHALGDDRVRLYAARDESVNGEVCTRYRGLIERRTRGVPVAYLTGRREFWSLPLAVNEHTLIPRPETEHLVEVALRLIRTEGVRHIADLGTGTGAIALAIAQECLHGHTQLHSSGGYLQPPPPGRGRIEVGVEGEISHTNQIFDPHPNLPPTRGKECVRIVATDISEKALAVARTNALRLSLSGIDFRLDDWCGALAGETFDLIVSNPPYVANDDPYLQQGDLPFEPRLALAAGRDGFDAIRKILAGAGACLRTGGWLALEHGFDQRVRLWELLETNGFQPIEMVRDYGGRERVTVSRWS